MTKTAKTTASKHVRKRSKEIRLALFLIALAAAWLGADHVSSFFTGFFEGAAGV